MTDTHAKPLAPIGDGFDLLSDKAGFVGPTFSLTNRLRRVAWKLCWFLLARWTPAPMHRWRIGVVRLWGGDIDWAAYIYPDVNIWAPWHLRMEKYATLGPGVVCYNIAAVRLGPRAVVSQRAHLCTGTHDYRRADFPLIARPIALERRAWVCAEAFVGPGVTVGVGAVLSARGVTFADLGAWTVNSGNPATSVRARPELSD